MIACETSGMGMRMRNQYAVFITAVAVGALLPRPSTTATAQAAPADVHGNPNQAVDTYRNRAGNFVLWANGRITKVSGGAADLGHPYSAPPPAAQLGVPPAQANQAIGSPNVAVKALTRPDGTWILFADGSFKKPANFDASAGAATASGNIVTGAWEVTDWRFGTRRSEVGCDVQVSAPFVEVWPSPPIDGPVRAFCLGFDSYYGAELPMRSDSTGSHIIFDGSAAGMQMTHGYFIVQGGDP